MLIESRISSTRPAEELPKEFDAHLVHALDSISDAFVLYDADGKLVLCNQKHRNFFPHLEDFYQPGTSREELIRNHAKMIHAKNSAFDIESYLHERLKIVNKPRPDSVVQLIDGRWVSIRERTVVGGGLVSIRTDITKQKTAEKKIKAQRDELAKLNEQKNKFFLIIYHDLRSPFTALLGYSEFLSMHADSINQDKISEYGSLIHRAASQAFELLEDLLDWSRLRLDRMEFELEPINIKEIIDANLARIEPAASTKNIQVNGIVAKNLVIHSDPRSIDTILRNLTNNAVKFTDQRGVIDVKACQRNSFVEIEVTDTGVGMNEDKLAKLFDRNKDSKSSLGTEGEIGTGLGLPLCKELVEKLGGNIHAQSVEGVGSSIRFNLPVPSSSTNKREKEYCS